MVDIRKSPLELPIGLETAAISDYWYYRPRIRTKLLHLTRSISTFSA
jgi:hypothetical protein